MSEVSILEGFVLMTRSQIFRDVVNFLNDEQTKRAKELATKMIDLASDKDTNAVVVVALYYALGAMGVKLAETGGVDKDDLKDITLGWLG